MKFRDQLAAAGNADILVVHASANARGLFVVSADTTLQDHLAWEHRDAKGGLDVQEICQRALKLKSGELAEAAYWTMPTDAKPSQKMLVRYVYFPAFDWVVAVQQPETDFLALATQIHHVFLISNFVPLALAILATFVAPAIFRKLTRKMTAQVQDVVKALEDSSSQFALALRSINGHADSAGTSADELFRSTQVQARSAEETSATTSSVAVTARQNSETAERMRNLSASAESILDGTKTTLADVGSAMLSIVDTNDRALTIIDSINEISFATNIVALNASIEVEAAKAGEAGRTFAFIAGEVRELSAKAATAAEETRLAINNSRTEVHRGTDYVNKLVAALLPMNENADLVRKLAVDVSATSQSQAKSMRQVLEAVESIQLTSGDIADSAQQGTKDAAELRIEVASLAHSVDAVDQALQSLNEEFFSAC